MEDKNINEGRTQIKRKYAAHGSIRVNEKAPIRNKVIQFVGKRFVTEEEMKSFLTQLTEDRGKEFDQRKWFGRNEKYFEAFENRGQKVWTLSKFGKRVLENVIKKSEQKQTINESVGLFKNIRINESIINEALVNAADVKDGATTLADRIKMIEDDAVSAGEEICDMKMLNAMYTTFSKTLKTPLNKLMLIDSESNASDFVLACWIGFERRRDAGNTNIKLVDELSFNSAWHSSGQRRPAFHWHIVDANIDIITYEDGDDWSDFSMVVYPKAQEKALINWVNANMTEEDIEY